MIRDWWISIRFCFVFQGSLLVIVLFRAIIDQLSLLRRFFIWSFSFLSLARDESNVCPLPWTKNPLAIVITSAILEQSRVILSKARRVWYIIICINPAFTKMIDGTEKPKIPFKFAKRAAQYNEFRCKSGQWLVVKVYYLQLTSSF